MDFLLECIGFTPELNHGALVQRVLDEGEPVPWRGDPENHRRLALASGLELRLDRDPGQEFWTLLPHFRVPHRLRVAVERIKVVEDSPFDALLTAWACPPHPTEQESSSQDPGAYLLSTWLTDARRLPRTLAHRHVLAVSVAGFALAVDYIGPNSGVRNRAILERPNGAHVQPLGSMHDPGGCSEVSLRIKAIRHLRNPLSGREVAILVTDAPERPLLLFVNPWQLHLDGLEAPRPGWRIEGSFLFTGTIAGGLRTPKSRVLHHFG